MARMVKTAEQIRDELNHAALRLPLDGEGGKIEFMLPTPADPEQGGDHNWDVAVYCPEGLDELCRRAVMQVAARYDLGDGDTT
ncbi:hypothetical protein SAMN05192583_1196 [Sphingomonas gellani]|uniref:Uncharacterized protein n=1 Tax=Sphingomonas gellani TaxID=1166340 RepID=A0A1H8B493_9SPHN|nr:hypothetical protein [Sphingomonas gellani]SEM77742.1 hypothetical protein SAMN05192583_1196 [Sphingomonas gellani]